MSSILITGAAGFIGSQLAHHLWENGDDVVLLDDFSFGHEDNLVFDDMDFRNSIIRADISDRVQLEDVFKNNSFDYVYNIAAIAPLPDCQLNPARAIAVNIGGTANVLELSRKYGAKKVITASTCAVYENTTDLPYTEENVKQPSLTYACTKYSAELFCKAYATVYGMNITVMRFSNVYGPHIDFLRTQPPVSGYIIRELYYGRAPKLHSNGKQKRDFVYVDDLIDLAVRAQQGEGYDVVNVVSGETHEVNEMFDIIAQMMKKTSIRPDYMPCSNYWKNFPEIYEGAYHIDEDRLEHEVVSVFLASNKHAKEKYGWVPQTDFETGLGKTVSFIVNKLSCAAVAEGKRP